jgi:hypothetical protein
MKERTGSEHPSVHVVRVVGSNAVDANLLLQMGYFVAVNQWHRLVGFEAASCCCVLAASSHGCMLSYCTLNLIARSAPFQVVSS